MPLNLPPPKASTSALPPSTNSGSEHAAPAVLPSSRLANLPPPSQPSDTSAGVASNGFKLPPPKTKAKSAASGPKKFVLDLPKPSRGSDEVVPTSLDQPAAKRPRTNGSGLSGLLPEPGNKPASGPAIGLKLPEPKKENGPSSLAEGKSAAKATSLLPHALKGKGKATTAAKELRAKELREADQAEQAFGEPLQPAEPALDFFGLAASNEPAEPAMDFFGLGGQTEATVPSLPSTIAKGNSTPVAAQSSKPKFSAAPSTAAPSISSNYYATLPVPSKDDPYPGFYQKADGSWAAKRPEEWEIWAAAQGWNEQAEDESVSKKKEKEYNMPADFDKSALNNSVEIRAAALRGAQDPADTRPSKITEEERKKMEADKAAAAANQKKFSHAAKSRHQLSTLIASAKDNRAELEERIAQMKSNKRSGGSKYGF